MKSLRWINTGALTAMLAVNGLANLIPIGGRTTGQVSEAYPTLFTPAPMTFAIWGVIYVMMIGFVLYQWGLFDGGRYSNRVRDRVGFWFAASCLFNIAWILCWHLKAMMLSVVFIFALLATLGVIEDQVRFADGNLFQHMIAKTGFDIYFGWIIAASVANVSVYLTALGWNGWGISKESWTVAMLLVSAIIAAAVVLLKRNRMAGLAVGWAYVGILMRHFSDAGYARMYPFVIAGGFIALLIVLDAVAIVSLNGFFCFGTEECGCARVRTA